MMAEFIRLLRRALAVAQIRSRPRSRIETMVNPVLRLERTARQIYYRAFDADSVLGAPIRRALEAGFQMTPPRTESTILDLERATWWRFHLIGRAKRVTRAAHRRTMASTSLCASIQLATRGKRRPHWPDRRPLAGGNARTTSAGGRGATGRRHSGISWYEQLPSRKRF